MKRLHLHWQRRFKRTHMWYWKVHFELSVFTKNGKKQTFTRWPRSVMHTDSLLHKELTPEMLTKTAKANFTKYTGRKVTVSLSTAVWTSRLTDWQADRQGLVCTGCTLIQPTGGTDTSSCSSHHSKFFVQRKCLISGCLSPVQWRVKVSLFSRQSYVSL